MYKKGISTNTDTSGLRYMFRCAYCIEIFDIRTLPDYDSDYDNDSDYDIDDSAYVRAIGDSPSEPVCMLNGCSCPYYLNGKTNMRGCEDYKQGKSIIIDELPENARIANNAPKKRKRKKGVKSGIKKEEKVD